jgi:hypothetical protein
MAYWLADDGDAKTGKMSHTFLQALHPRLLKMRNLRRQSWCLCLLI